MPVSTSNLADIETRIQELESELADLKEHRNLLVAPLCRLPNELVVEIFLLFQKDWLEDTGEDDFHSGRIPWWGKELALCRRIRCITLQSPQLWSFVRLGGQSRFPANDYEFEWMSLCLKHAKNNPITLRLELDRMDNITNHLAILAPRTRKLNLEVLFDSEEDINAEIMNRWSDMFVNVVTQSWTSLEQAYIFCVCDSPEVFITPHFLTGAAQTLTALELIGDHEPWVVVECPDFPNLQHLTVRYVRWDNRIQLWKWLSNTPGLLSLRLWFIGGKTLPASHIKPLNLTKLQSLVLTGSSRHIVAAAQSLPDPSDELSLHSNIPEIDRNDEGQQKLVQHGVAYLDRSRKSGLFQNAHVLALRECNIYPGCDQGGKQVRYRLKPALLASGIRRGRRLELNGEGAKMSSLFPLLQFSDTLELTTKGLMSYALELMWTPTSTHHVNTLSLACWDHYSQARDTMENLEEYLRERARHGVRLETLMIDARDIDPISPLSGWIFLGLVGHVVTGTEVKL